MQTDILIVGGGVSGLALADHLQSAGRDYLLVEARARLGGRVLGARTEAATYDLGPAWFWSGQPRMETLAARLKLRVFEQHSAGALTAENEAGQVQRGQGFASMQGSLRIEGGMQAMVDQLAAGLPADRLKTSASVLRLSSDASGVTAHLANGTQIRADKVVLAVPPRLAAETIAFAPALPDAALRAMTTIATWMAGQAKAIAVYDEPFWREDGLSGDAMSRRGPMVEIHDASPASGKEGALFGFIGVPPDLRRDEDALRTAVSAQLVRLFGPRAAHHTALFVKDWACDAATATAADTQPLFAHPAYGLPKALTDLWGGKLLLAGTEVAHQHGGFLEGALEAAETAAQLISESATRARAS